MNEQIHISAFIAPNAFIHGDVTIGKNCRIMYGAQLIAENSPIAIGDNCIVLENAVIRATEGFPVTIGNNCLVGPNAHLAGCTVEDAVFIATGASVFHGATLKKGSEVRINGVVHLKTVLPKDVYVPINWIALGNPARLFSPDEHEKFRNIQKELNFPLTVYCVDRENKSNAVIMEEICKVMSERLKGKAQSETSDRA